MTSAPSMARGCLPNVQSSPNRPNGWTARRLDRLEASLAAQKHCLNDPVQFLICDREFHFAIYRCAANPLLSDFVMGLYTYLMEQRRTAVSQPGAILRSYRDHTEILARSARA